MASIIKASITNHTLAAQPSSTIPRALIVTADDFGYSREVNAGVLRAHREGILTGTSLMVAGAARDEATAMARDCPRLDVGLHLVVCRGFAITRSPLLVADDAAFSQHPTLAGLRYYFDRRLRSCLRDEIRAQIELHLKLVGYLHHIDGHLNFHVHPVIADLLIDLAGEYHVPCVRLPREPVLTTLALAPDKAARKLTEAVIFRALSGRTRRLLSARGIRSSDWLFGLHQSGDLSEAYVKGVIQRLRPGLTELYFHPALDAGGTPPVVEAQEEVAILTSPAVRAALEVNRVRLTNFAEIVRDS